MTGFSEPSAQNSEASEADSHNDTEGSQYPREDEDIEKQLVHQQPLIDWNLLIQREISPVLDPRQHPFGGVRIGRLEDHSHMLRHLSDDALPSTLNQGDGAGSWRAPAARHPRDVEIIPKSRDFH